MCAYKLHRRPKNGTHTQLVCHSEGPGKIKRREVVLDSQVKGPGEIKRREVVLDPVVSPDHEQGGGAGL